jgi:hypothetical protein
MWQNRLITAINELLNGCAIVLCAILIFKNETKNFEQPYRVACK